MTFSEWSNKSGIEITSATVERQAISIVIAHNHPMRLELWKLDDYVVSSVGGDVHWLVPRWPGPSTD